MASLVEFHDLSPIYHPPQRAPNSPEPWELAIFRGKIFSNPLGWSCWDMLRWSSRNCSRGPGPSFDLPAEQTPPRLPRKLAAHHDQKHRSGTGCDAQLVFLGDLEMIKWFVWKWVVPLNPMVLLIIIPIKWLFHWEYTLFSDKAICFPVSPSRMWNGEMVLVLDGYIMIYWYGFIISNNFCCSIDFGGFGEESDTFQFIECAVPNLMIHGFPW